MEREIIGDQIAEEVIGGSIVFTPDHKQCGLNCTTQCKVNDYNAVIEYIKANYKTMTEGKMLKNMVSMGLLTRL